ncbi:signal transduction histidine kinase, nitrogen specific, NtrB [Desulfofarcimen acetoxidans DSM 771]|uniref:histidine kinase n=2 Tax=Desulfofarcimen acetoxidans TaxID=58138 RepID=C8W6P0_DESAS|nr:signal transduction histidine kinase, nitrogen specific, NtrB [Desulfofarcimen acetoxidans DSM 771]
MGKDNRQAEINEYLISMHIYCNMLLLFGLIFSYKIHPFIGCYTTFNIFIFLLLGLSNIGIIVFYNKYCNDQENDNRFNWVNIPCIVLPTIISSIAIFTISNNVLFKETILFIPVLIAASIMGKNTGIFMAFICSLILVFHDLLTKDNIYIIKVIESNIIFISVLFIVGWFTGRITGIEAQHRKSLNKSLLSLQKEIHLRNIAEEEMRKLTRAVELSPSIMIITDLSGNIEYVNSKFKQITGFTSVEIFNKNIADPLVNHNMDYSRIWETVKSGNEWSGELFSKKKNGEIYIEYVSMIPFKDNEGVITHFLRASENITERKQMEKEIARLDKLNLVGEMAAGIGHEIRNPMTTVRGFLQLLASKEECVKYKEYYDLMIEELDRANSIITEYLSLAKNKPVSLRMVNLNSILATIFPLIQADVLKRNNDVKMEIKDVPDLILDENEIRQLILNLVRNSLEAMPLGGNLTIKTFQDKDFVVLEVQDEGSGIPLELLDKIGTPFFTTKDEGTGLGLAVCFSIAARHNASIEVNTDSSGTVFSVKFCCHPTPKLLLKEKNN